MNKQRRELAQRIVCGLARAGDFERLGVDDVKAIKSDIGQVHYRFVDSDVKAAMDDEEDEKRTFEHVASTEHVDSMGDVIKVSGWDLSRLKVGRVPLFWGHESFPVPMGIVQRAKRDKAADGVKALVTTSRFHEADVFGDSEWGKHVESVRKLVARGDLPGVSVGFVPKASRWPEQEEREALGMPAYGMIFEEQELLELSVTPIPANSRAQQKKEMARYREAVRDLVVAGDLEAETAEALIAQLSAGEDAWLRRIERLGREIVPLTKELPWAKGKPGSPAVPEPLGMDAVAARIEAAALAGIEKIVQAASITVRREVAAVIREQIEPLECSTVAAAERIEEAASLFERAATRTPNAPKADAEATRDGSHATAAVSTGTSRDIPTNPTPRMGAAEALARAVDAAARREGPDRDQAGPGQGSSRGQEPR